MNAGELSNVTQASGKRLSQELEGGSTLKMTTKRWTPTLWNQSGGLRSVMEKGLVYQGTRVVPFSTSLGTVLSNFEAGQNYQDVQDPAVTVFFKVESKNCYIAAWTTTPWTLPLT